MGHDRERFIVLLKKCYLFRKYVIKFNYVRLQMGTLNETNIFHVNYLIITVLNYKGAAIVRCVNPNGDVIGE